MSAALGLRDELSRYLLADLSEDERQRIELAFLRDDALFEELQALEDELVHDSTSAGERGELIARLERSPSGRRRLRAARELTAALAARQSSALPRWLPLAAAASLLLVVFLLGLLLLDRRGSGRAFEPGPPVTAKAEPVTPTAPTVPAVASASNDPATASAPATIASVVALTLSAGLTRHADTAPQRVTLAGEVVELRLQLRLPETASSTDDSRLRATLWSAAGDEVFVVGGLAVEGEGVERAVVLAVPAARLAEDDYELSLSDATGHSILADYQFGVLRQP